MPRWVCPECGKGKNGPQRPRLDNVIRYCLPCSENSGVLVKRSAPALEKKRAAAYTRSREKAATKRQKQRASETWGGIHIPTEAKIIWRLMKPYHGGRAMPKIRIRNKSYGTSGHCKLYSVDAEIVMSISPNAGTADVWNLLAHELCHSARGASYAKGRWAMHDERFYAILTEVTRKRFLIDVALHEHSGRWGYAVDWLIRDRLHEAGLTTRDGQVFIDVDLADERRSKRDAQNLEADQ